MRSNYATRDIPVVMFRDSEDESDLMRSYGAGANGYVVKPRTLNDLVECLRKICQVWLGRNVLPGGQPDVGDVRT